MTEYALVAVIAFLLAGNGYLAYLLHRQDRALRDDNATLLRAVIAKDPQHTANVSKLEREQRRPTEAAVMAEVQDILSGMGDGPRPMPVGLNGD